MIALILLFYFLVENGGGIKGGYLEGEANVSSKIKNREIASGTANYQSFHLEYDERIIPKKPDSTGLEIFSYSLVAPRYFQQKIEISDFRKSINQPQNSDEKIISTKITNLDGSETFDPSDPNTYEIDMNNSSL